MQPRCRSCAAIWRADAESRDASRHSLDAAAKAYCRYQVEVQVDFKRLNLCVVGMLLAEASVDAS